MSSLAIRAEQGLPQVIPTSVRDDSVEAASLCALLNGARADEAHLHPDAYVNATHRKIFEAIKTVALRKSRPTVDIALVRSELQRKGEALEIVERAELIATLDGKPTALSDYVEHLHALHVRRSAILELRNVAVDLLDRDTATGQIANALHAVIALLTETGKEGAGGDMVRSLKDDILQAIEDYQNPGASALAFLPLPFPGLADGPGGLRGIPSRKKSTTIGVIAARSGNGKTALIATVLHHWICTMGLKGGLVGLEDGVEWLIDRWAARDIDADWGAIRCEPPRETYILESDARFRWVEDRWWTRNPHSGERCLGVADLLDCYEHVLDDRLFQYHGANIASPHLISMIRRWIAKGARFVVVDHGLRVDYAPGRNERLDLAIKRGLDGLNEISIETGVPILLAWHLNRKGEDGTPPTMNDIKESGYLDSVAALIIGAWREENGRTLANVIKSRKSGGIGRVAELVWSGQSGMFRPDECGAVDLAAERRAAREASRPKRKGGF